MKVKVYVRWDTEEILSEKEYQDFVNNEVEDIMEDEDSLSRACAENFDALELFYMDSKNENDIEKIKSTIRENIEDDLNIEGWDEVEIEI